MTDTEFMDQAERVLKAVEANCDRINEVSSVDIDNQRTGGMVTLVFANRSQIVINLQKPLHEIWLAETRAERDAALAQMSGRYVYFRPGDAPTLDFEKVDP